eukprot:CAMPEP_0175261410 /NCGR_PEP_ID=MMETSP0093-20121207/40747_1 /TAXON_ID=311494 /ORGANISM="Alexandrium monilatum, Strain CCMP3105" /LENGTH=48 /DNA_ID= /DNA_START= /DNA_END= /DNA_ORIENTATION=
MEAPRQQFPSSGAFQLHRPPVHLKLRLRLQLQLQLQPESACLGASMAD